MKQAHEGENYDTSSSLGQVMGLLQIQEQEALGMDKFRGSEEKGTHQAGPHTCLVPASPSYESEDGRGTQPLVLR